MDDAHTDRHPSRTIAYEVSQLGIEPARVMPVPSLPIEHFPRRRRRR